MIIRWCGKLSLVPTGDVSFRFTPKSDIERARRDVSFVPIADIAARLLSLLNIDFLTD
jgi:hypothetical protein